MDPFPIRLLMTISLCCESRECAVTFHFHIEVSSQIIYDWMAGKNIGMYKLKVEMGRDYYVYRKKLSFVNIYSGSQLINRR